MKKKSTKPLLPTNVFLIDLAIFKDQVVVAINAEKKDVVDYLKKNKCEAWYLEAIEKEWDELFDPSTIGCMAELQSKDKKHSGFFMRFEGVRRNVEFQAVALHETFHFIDALSEHRGIEDEREARAYAAEHVWMVIMSKIA